MEKVDLSVIYVSHNSAKFISESIKSLKKHLKGLNFEIIIVDNNSDESEVKELDNIKKSVSDIEIIPNLENKGFGSGNNIGAKKAKGEYLLFINPDTLIIDDSVEKLLIIARTHPEIGILSPVLYQKDGHSLQKHFYGQLQNLQSILSRKIKEPIINLKKEIFYTQMVSGAAMLIRRQLFIKIGGFDENIFMYLEDDDLCRRILSIGFKIAVIASAKIIHLEDGRQTTVQKRKIYYQSQKYYFRKHFGLLNMLLLLLIRTPYTLIKTRK